MKRLPRIACSILSLNLVGCNLAAQKNIDDGVGNSGPVSENSAQVPGRYQFEKDPQGRLFRLDTTTGEVTRVQTSSALTTPTPRRTAPQPPNRVETSQVEGSSPSFSQSTSTAGRTARGSTRVVQSDPIDTAGAARSTQAVSRSTTSSNPCPASGIVVVTSDRLEVFFNAQQDGTPIASLPRGTELTILETKGEWRLVRFADPQWGQRAGYIPCALPAN
jgi:hypothetical protein